MHRRILRNLSSSIYYGTHQDQFASPKPLKKPQEYYFGPSPWTLKFEKPAQVAGRTWSCSSSASANVGKTETYKNPEYFSYHTYSYYNMEEDLNCKRCRGQPSSIQKQTPDEPRDKCPF